VWLCPPNLAAVSNKCTSAYSRNRKADANPEMPDPITAIRIHTHHINCAEPIPNSPIKPVTLLTNKGA
jgi:hypothetical protein